jgi:hypothetical protein
MEKAGTVSRRRRSGINSLGASQVNDQILTSREARRLLKIGRTKLHELTKRQAIPAYRIGSGRTSGLRYLRGELMQWLSERKI